MGGAAASREAQNLALEHGLPWLSGRGGGRLLDSRHQYPAARIWIRGRRCGDVI